MMLFSFFTRLLLLFLTMTMAVHVSALQPHNTIMSLLRSNHLGGRRVLQPTTTTTTPFVHPDDGIWTSRGYGWVFLVTNGTITWLEETNISCVVRLAGFVLEDLGVENVQLGGDNETLLSFTEGITQYKFDKLNSFAGACANGILRMAGDPAYERDPLALFDIMTQTFTEHYAFFELRGVEWENTTSQVRQSISNVSTDEELFVAMTQILAPLNDAHVSLTAGDDASFVSGYDPVEERFTTEFVNQNEEDSLDVYVTNQLLLWLGIVDSLLDDNGLMGDTDAALYGRFEENPDVGYLLFLSFFPDDPEMFATQLASAMTFLHDCRSIVVDVRLNGGGYDVLALLVASYFTTDRFHAFTKRAVDGDGFTEPQKVYVEAAADASTRFDGQVVLVTSGSTMSAADVFALVMSQLPQVTILGSNTMGTFSDVLDRTLPNGWVFSVSNEVYESSNGMVYEGIGISPSIRPETELLPLSERQEGIDSWLELAVLFVATNVTTTPKEPAETTQPTHVATTESPTLSPTASGTSPTYYYYYSSWLSVFIALPFVCVMIA